MDSTGNDPWNFHKCKCCSYRTRLLSNIRSHVRWICHRTRLDNQSCNQRLLTPDKYQCEKCHNLFDLKIHLTRHFNLFHKQVDTQHYQDPIPRKCGYCDFHTFSLLVLLSHYSRFHETENDHPSEQQEKYSNRQMFEHTKLQKIKRNHQSIQRDHCLNEFTVKDETENDHQCEEQKKYSNQQMFEHTKLQIIKDNHPRIQQDHCLNEVTVKDRFNCDLHSLEKYQCKCVFQTDFKILLTRHFNRFHKGVDIEHYITAVLRTCENCDFQTYSLLVLLSHCSRNHIFNIPQIENCRLSEEEDTNQQGMNDHRFDCDMDSPDKYLCKICQLQCDFKVLLTRHFNTFHKEKDTKHYPDAILQHCRGCGFQTFSLLVMLSHQSRCNGKKKVSNRQFRQRMKLKKITRLQCDLCSYTATKKSVLKVHALKKHTSSKQISWFKCEECSYKGKDKGYLRKHVLAKHSQPDELEKLKRFKCDICSYKTIHKTSLKFHINNVHTPTEEIIWIKCEQCAFKTKTKSRLRRHVISRHAQPEELDKLKRFECDRCSYKTTLSTRLKEHVLRRHTPKEEINWFKCAQCPYKGKEKKALQQHLLRCNPQKRRSSKK